jgi:anti-sigma regulatory factor (Ser/Thr protein kinase)
MKVGVSRQGNVVIFAGEFGRSDVHNPLACIHHATRVLGYSDVTLDFSACSAAFAPPMLALCAQVMRLRESGTNFDVVLPEDKEKRRLFENTNWAHFLEPGRFQPSAFRGHSQVAATQFKTPNDQNNAVNRIVDAILGAIPDIERSDFAALEWSINEITDNVIVHAESAIGGLVQVSTFRKRQKVVEYIVADAGLGVPATLRSGYPQMSSDTEALDRAIREGVTRDKALGQGNGLFGSYQICSHSGGRFQIESGHAKLEYTPNRGLSISSERVPIAGTLIIAQIDFSSPRLLAEALRFAGKVHKPVDYIETRYELHDSDDLAFVLKEEAGTFGSRLAGTPVRNRLLNLLRMCPGQRIRVDCADIPLVSSSFADEVFGKLFVELGPLRFMQRIALVGVEPTVRHLIDKAISQRVAASGATP